MGDYTLLIRSLQDFKRTRPIASAATALPHGGVLFLQTVKHLLGWNSRAAHDPGLNRVFQFRHFAGLPFLMLFQDAAPKTVRRSANQWPAILTVRTSH